MKHAKNRVLSIETLLKLPATNSSRFSRGGELWGIRPLYFCWPNVVFIVM